MGLRPAAEAMFSTQRVCQRWVRVFTGSSKGGYVLAMSRTAGEGAGRKERKISSAGQAGGITTVMMLINIVVGFGFQSLIAATIGLSQLADAFQGTWAVVTFGATVQLTMVTSFLVPHLQVTQHGVSTMARTRLPMILGVMGASFQVIAALLVSGDMRPLLLASAPSHLFVAATALPLARAYVGRRFVAASSGAIANGIALLAITAAGNGAMGPWLLGAAVSVGYMAQWIATVIGIRGVAPLGPVAGMTIRLFVGVTAYTLFSKLQPVLERAISLAATEGATAALGFGQKIAYGLLLVGTFSLALTTTAALSRHVSSGNWNLAGVLLSKTAVASFTLTSAVIAVALPLAHPAVVVLFQRGEFTAGDSRIVSDILVLQLPWVLAAVLTGVFTACLYQLRWYSRVLVGSAAGLLGMVGISLALAGAMPMFAVAIGSSVGAIITLLVTIALLLRSPIGDAFRHAVVERLPLIVKSLGLLTGSIAAYSGLALSGVANQFWPGVITGAATAAVIAICLLMSGATRMQLREALGAEV